MSDHEHHHHTHQPGHSEEKAGSPGHSEATAGAPDLHDAGSQALSEALRSSFFIVKLAMAALVVVILVSGIFTVGPQEKAIVLRFGKPVVQGTNLLLGAGLHWAWPQPVDEVVKIPVTPTGNLQVRSTVGWYYVTPEQEVAGTEPPGSGTLNPAIDGSVITADRNIVHSRATVTYHIDDPRAAIFDFGAGTNHEFNLEGVSNALLNAANEAVVGTAARFNVDDILTDSGGEYHAAIQRRITDLADAEHLGVAIDLVEVRSVAPRQLADVFAQVTSARQNREKVVTDARADAERILNNATARAYSVTNTAETARNNFVQSVRSEAGSFTNILAQFQGNPRLYEELELAKAMSVVLTNVQDKIYLPQRADGQPRELRLQLNREPQEPNQR
ncbi:MAG TPA: SPFH domain-containing protein [Candidatus Sulfotelmatobacter sp.]|jgi:membrane protease subunit HflK|nr:SPFH domain-containing protein [Candidatus Sulfotelmatobacter sp.]